jgi:hypothetical protein
MLENFRNYKNKSLTIGFDIDLTITLKFIRKINLKIKITYF